jgi:AcrR family transcriptional regulator
MTSIGSRAVRADGQRNRQRVLTAARQAFASGDAPVALEAIARQAGVGIGTLYRHFPSREALVEAVYRKELEQLRASADELLASHDAADALRKWMDHFASYVAAKRGMAEALRAVVASGIISSTETRDTLTAAIGRLLAAGAAAGTLRADVRTEDVLASLTGVFLAAGASVQREQAGRMLDLLMDGLRAAGAPHVGERARNAR